MDSIPYFHVRIGKEKYFFRPILPIDKSFIQDGFKELSSSSKYLRFFAYQNELSQDQLKYFSEVDGFNHVAWGAMDLSNMNEPKPVGTARYIKVKDEEGVAEVALTVVDRYQRKGLGRILLAILNIIGAKQGIESFRYHVLPDNTGILKSIHSLRTKQVNLDHNTLLVEARVVGNYKEIEDDPENEKFMESMKLVEAYLK